MLQILNLIIDTVTALLATVLLLRFWMQAIRIRPPLQIAQFTFQLSDWLIKPLRRFVPGVGGFDWASMLAAYLVALLATIFKFALLPILMLPQVILLASVFTLMHWMIYGCMGLLFISVIFSWVNPTAQLAPFFAALAAPILRPIQRFLPPFGNVDLSPIVAFLVLQIANVAIDEIARVLLRQLS